MDSSESLRHIAEHLRRLARAAYGSPCRVQVTDETLREYAAELERIAAGIPLWLSHHEVDGENDERHADKK